MVTKGQYFAIKAALTSAEKELINFYELQWHLKHNVPSIEEVTQHLRIKRPNIKQVTVNYYLARAPVKKALKERGIPFEQHTREDLTATQVAVAVTMMNFADTRSNDDKLEQLGINPSQYYAWLNDPQFKNLIDTLSEQNLTNIKPTAIAEFTKKINQGDWNAVKYYLDVTGTANSQEAPHSEVIIIRFIEILQKHIKDPDLMVAIAKDLKAASTNRTLEVIEQPVIESYATNYDNDPELDSAKKMLGFG